MTKFLTLWEVDTSKLPESPEEQAKLLESQFEMIKKDGCEWGMFAGRLSGYSVSPDMDEQEISLKLMKYVPYVKFKVYPVITLDQVIENSKKLAEGKC